VSNSPARPTKGSPCVSSSVPGASPHEHQLRVNAADTEHDVSFSTGKVRTFDETSARSRNRRTRRPGFGTEAQERSCCRLRRFIRQKRRLRCRGHGLRKNRSYLLEFALIKLSPLAGSTVVSMQPSLGRNRNKMRPLLFNSAGAESSRPAIGVSR